MSEQVFQSLERRRDPRQPRAFAFWIRRDHNPQRHSAWMLDASAGGAAFLTGANAAPQVGDRLELSEMQTCDRLVREDAQTLPKYARVVRLDDRPGVTRQVAVRFEADADVDLDESPGPRSRSVAECQPPAAPGLPPMPRTASGDSALESRRLG